MNNNKELEIMLYKEMLNIYQEALKIGYSASKFKQMVANQGGYKVAKTLLHSKNLSNGFLTLKELERLDLTVEALILNPMYQELFTEEERDIARDRLKQFGYKGLEREFEYTIEIPVLEPKSRTREYNSYKDSIRDRVIYEYLFNARTHRWLDENIIGLDADYSKGYQSMGILHFIGLKEKHKGLFEEISIYEAIEKLKKLDENNYKLVIASLERTSNLFKVGLDIQDNIYEEKEYVEGKEHYRLHRYRERDAGLTREAKKRFMLTYGELFCEACGLNFEKLYGERGQGFIEAHHTKPISEMVEGEVTRIEDIAMLCSNCHRMIHRSPLITVEELRILVKKV